MGPERFEYTHMRDICRHAVIGALCSLLLPLSAYAQNGKRPDPDSPAGVEYQLPLDQARKNATGGDGGPPGGSDRDRGGGGTPRLFGAGIVAAKAGGSTDGGGSAASGDATAGEGDAAGARSAGRDEEGGEAPAPDLTRSALQAPDEGGGSTGLQIAGIVLAVLLLGVLTGLLLRRSLRQSGT